MGKGAEGTRIGAGLKGLDGLDGPDGRGGERICTEDVLPKMKSGSMYTRYLNIHRSSRCSFLDPI